MGVKRKKYCVTCIYENASKNKIDNTGGVAIWCNYKNKHINNKDRQSVWCSDWVVHGNFTSEEFEDTLASRNENLKCDYSPSKKTFAEKATGFIALLFLVVFSSFFLFTFGSLIYQVLIEHDERTVMLRIVISLMHLLLAIYSFKKWRAAKNI